MGLRTIKFRGKSIYDDEWLYNVWDGKKSLGWAPECDLEPLQLPS